MGRRLLEVLGKANLQHHRYVSPEWQRIHSYGPQVIEFLNGSLKHADNATPGSPAPLRCVPAPLEGECPRAVAPSSN